MTLATWWACTPCACLPLCTYMICVLASPSLHTPAVKLTWPDRWQLAICDQPAYRFACCTETSPDQPHIAFFSRTQKLIRKRCTVGPQARNIINDALLGKFPELPEP